MSRFFRVSGWFLPLVLGLSSTAFAGSLELKDGTTFDGAVLSLEEDTVKFLVQTNMDGQMKFKDDTLDEAFRATGSSSKLRVFHLASVAKINGVAIEGYSALHDYNVLYRVYEDFDAARIKAVTEGTFVNQIKSVVVFLLVILLGLPLLLKLVSNVLPGEGLGFFGAVGASILLTVFGFGAFWLSGIVAGLGGFGASPVCQVGLCVVYLALFGMVVHWASRFSVWQGLAFAIVWGGTLYAAGRITAKIMGFTDA
jgi:hypothetical protein